MAVTFEQTNLTVKMAGDFLANNTGNRPFKRNTIDKYVRDILAGRWHFTAEPIKLDGEGRLLDGQNRCMALLKASEESGNPDLSLPVLIVRGLEPEAQDVMDTGKARSVGDQLARRGAKDYAIAASASRLCVLYDTGHLVNGENPTHSQIIEYYDANAEAIQQFVTHARPGNFSAVTPSVLSAAGYLIYRECQDYDEVVSFINSIKEGAGLETGHPVLSMRNRLQQAQLSNERIVNTVALMMVLRAWNAHRRGEKLEKFPIRSRGKLITVVSIQK